MALTPEDVSRIAHLARLELSPAESDAMLADLEQRAAHLLRDLRGGMLNDARGKVRENVLFSLVIAIGFGFIVGVLFTGWGRGK